MDFAFFALLGSTLFWLGALLFTINTIIIIIMSFQLEVKSMYALILKPKLILVVKREDIGEHVTLSLW